MKYNKNTYDSALREMLRLIASLHENVRLDNAVGLGVRDSIYNDIKRLSEIGEAISDHINRDIFT